MAGGLHLGGATPLVLIQCTGLFESGDSLRNIVHDWTLPIFSVIGYRSYLNQERYQATRVSCSRSRCLTRGARPPTAK